MPISYSSPNLEGQANVLLTPRVIAQEALRLLKNNLVAAGLVHRNLESMFGKKIGDLIDIRMPARHKVQDGRVLSVTSPIVNTTTQLRIDKQHYVAINFSTEDRTLSLTDFSNRELRSAMVQMAHRIDRTILRTIMQETFFSSGTPGTALAHDVLTDGCALMEMVGVPMDGEVNMVYSPLDRAAITKELKDSNNERFAGNALLKNYDGTLSGFNLYSTANLPLHTVGTKAGTPLVNGASQSGASLITDGWTASSAILRKGDVFEIAGVFEVNPQTYETTGRLQRFVVTADVSSNGSGQATIAIDPAINSGAQTTLDGLGASISTTAYQNVTALPADNAAITVIGTASTSYRQAIAWHRDAVAFAMVPMVPPDTAVVAESVMDPETGLAILMTGFFDGVNHRETYRLDCLYGVRTVYPELAHKFFSAAA